MSLLMGSLDFKNTGNFLDLKSEINCLISEMERELMSPENLYFLLLSLVSIILRVGRCFWRTKPYSANFS
jgi:hypothetical protein